MKYTQKSFTVAAVGKKSPESCGHGWIDERGKCVLCGEQDPVKTLRGQIIRTEATR